MAQILIFGDSITWGAKDIVQGGWVEKLRMHFMKKGSEVYNLGISDDTTEDLLERFESETKQRIYGKENIFIFEIGTNDSAFLKSRKENQIKAEKFRQNIENLIKLAKKFSSKIIFVGLIPVDESKTNPAPWNKDFVYSNKYIEYYNDAIKMACKKNKIYFIELSGKLANAELEDGLHPNSKGHEKIFEIVRDFLIKNKII